MDFKQNLPGVTQYDKAYEQETATQEGKTEAATPKQGHTTMAEESKTDIKRQFAITSLILGISSFLIIFVIPIFGIALATVGGVFGIIFGVISRKQHTALAWTGIIISIIALVMVLIAFIILCLLGWGLVMSFVSHFSQNGYYEWPSFPGSFYYR